MDGGNLATPRTPNLLQFLGHNNVYGVVQELLHPESDKQDAKM